jgi:UDP-galactopyranose mutase
MSRPDYLIVGAGFFGVVIAEQLASLHDKKVLIIDKRDHIGGNCYSQMDEETGIEYHKYGTHIFHTSCEKVIHYLNRFTEWNGYYHQVLTTHRGKVFQMPINLETINSFFNKNLKPFEVASFLEELSKSHKVEHPINLEEKAISQIGPELYQAFICGYTEKQWGRHPSKLPPQIIGRLPIRHSYQENYFHRARWQGIPLNGYTAIFEKMLDHPNIEIKLNTDFFAIKDQIKPLLKTIYTGPIDRYFNYSEGKLEWRSIQLERKVETVDDFQGTSVMNFADLDVPYTRIHEPKHLHLERDYRKDKTLLFYEKSGQDPEAPFYPIRDAVNMKIYQKYTTLTEKCNDTVFGGRLGTYSYLDMDQVIASALALIPKLI